MLDRLALFTSHLTTAPKQVRALDCHHNCCAAHTLQLVIIIGRTHAVLWRRSCTLTSRHLPPDQLALGDIPQPFDMSTEALSSAHQPPSISRHCRYFFSDCLNAHETGDPSRG